jgi:hypothetical protein
MSWHMRPDILEAFHGAIRFGPSHCPADLFTGSASAIVRGLKVHANNIAYARHIALEETYPKLLTRVGTEAFHAAAARFLDNPVVLGRSLDELGANFHKLVERLADRDLARVEWAWLQAFHAPERVPLTLEALATIEPKKLVEAHVVIHPSLHIVLLEEPNEFDWDEPISGAGDRLLITRPDADVEVRRIGEPEAQIVELLERAPSVGELLGENPTLLLALVEAGAIYLGD